MPKNDTFDKELELMNLYGLKKIKSFKEEREDYAVRKRVELHCHTKMSDMDACVEANDIVKCAKKFGHTAVALTDHGDVQGFPVAFHALSGLSFLAISASQRPSTLLYSSNICSATRLPSKRRTYSLPH